MPKSADPFHGSYGRAHQQARERLLKRLPAPCPGCGTIMTPATAELHHSQPGAKERGLPGDVLICRRCNRADGARKTNAIRSARNPGRARKAEAKTRCTWLAASKTEPWGAGVTKCDAAHCHGKPHAWYCAEHGGWHGGGRCW